jgi:hypothetical protein
MAIWYAPTREHMEIDEEGVKAVNSLRMMQADRYLFCPLRIFPGSSTLPAE